MSEERNFDDFIKEEFKNYSPGVAPHIWEKIAAERKKRRPVGFWFTSFSSTTLLWVIALLLAGTIGAKLFIAHSSAPAGITKTENNNSTISAVNTNNGINKDEKDKQGLSSVKSNSSSLNVIQPNSQNSSNNKLKNVETKEVASLSQSIPAIKNTIVYGKYKHTLNLPGIIHTKTNNSMAGDNVQSNENPANTGFAKDDNMATPGILGNTSYNSNKKITDNLSRRLLLTKADILSLDKFDAPSLLQQKNKAIANLPECPTIEKEAAGDKKYIEIYVAPDYALRTLTDTANSVYLQKRKETTQVSSAFSAGIRYTRVFNNAMSIRAGLNYSQINETFSYVDGNVVQTTYTIDPNTGDTTGSYTVRGTRYKTTYNHYRSIDIPVTIGYELGNGRFHANINVGVIANIYSWQKGDELDTNLQPVSINTGKGGSPLYQFRTNIGLGTTGGVSFYYKLTDLIHLMAEPYLRYNFEPLSTNNLSLRQNYTTIGLRVGLRFDLPKAGSIIKR